MQANLQTSLAVSLIFSAMSLAARADEPSLATSDTPVAEKKLQPQEVRELTSLVLTRESLAKTPAERDAAVRDLSTLYLALARDTVMAKQSKLQLKAKIHSRLIAIREDLESDIQRRKEGGNYPEVVATTTADAQTTDDTAHEARGGAAVRDYGETLVELIQHTIAPEHWDVSGGPGSIVYWPNLQVLVVRAAGDAHGRVGGLFDGLRAAK